MSNYSSLKSTINANIKQNGNEEITGPILNSVLNAMVDSLAGYHYSGIATPATNPGTPDSNVFYLASEAGTYTNFGGLAVAEGEVAILKYNGTWTKEVTGAATAAELSQLAQEVDDLDKKLYGENKQLSPTLVGKFIYTNKNVGEEIDFTDVGTNPNYNCFVKDCSPYGKFTFNGSGGASPRLWCFIDSENKVVSVADESASLNGDIFVPAGAVKAIINIITTNPVEYFEFGDISQLTPLVSHENLVDKIMGIPIVKGYMINWNTMQIQLQSAYSYAKIALKTGDSIVIKTDGTGSNVGLVCRTDKNWELTELCVKGVSGVYSYSYTIPSDGFFLINYKHDNWKVSVNGHSLFDSISSRLVKIEENIKEPIKWENGYLINAQTLAPQSSADYRYSNPIWLKTGDNIEISTTGYGASLVSSCDESEAITGALVVSVAQTPASKPKVYSYTVLSDGLYILCYKYLAQGGYASINGERIDSGEKHINILVLGNSYTADAWTYVPHILKNYGITCNLLLYCRGALTLENLYNRWNDTQYSDTETGINAGTYYRVIYHIDTRYMTSWRTLPTGELSAKMLVEMDKWDIIDITQYSVASLDINTYEPFEGNVVGTLIPASLTAPYCLFFNQAWTRASDDNPQLNVETSLAFSKIGSYSHLVPCGTAIFNARQNPSLDALGATGHLWDDSVHLQEGLPKYIAALVVVQCIFNQFFGLSVLNDQTRPTEENINAWNIPQRRALSVGVTEGNCYLAQKAAILAIRYPFEILQV